MKKVFAVLFFSFFAAGIFAKNNKSLDAAISASADKLDQGIPKDKVIAVLNIKSGSDDLSNYIIDNLIYCLIKTGIHKIVDRDSEDALIIKNELKYQYSGEVNEETAQQIGYSTAAGAVVSGSVEKIGKWYMLKVKAINVETREILVSWNTKITDSDDVDNMLNITVQSDKKHYSAHGFSVGVTGGIQLGLNNNGAVFSDKENIFTNAGCDISEINYNSFTGRAFIKYTRSPGFGLQTEFFYWNGGREVVASASSVTAGAVKIKYYSFDVPVLVSFSFPVFKTTASLLAGADISFPQKGILYDSLAGGSREVSTGTVVIPGFIVGIDYSIPLPSQLSIVLGFRYFRDLMPYTVKFTDGTSDSVLIRGGFNFDAGLQFSF
jgi:hypothetical protein